jgi:hypothetical protein
MTCGGNCNNNSTQCDDCTAMNLFPKALWCNYRGKETFTGMVMVNQDMATRKLDDPNGELDGPSHLMPVAEFISEMCHYDGLPRSKLLDELKSVNLIDFADAESRSNINIHEEFDIKYPHGLPGRGAHGIIQQVRSSDNVKVVAHGLIHGQPFRERFWVHVDSVTATLPDGTNIVTGTAACDGHLHGVDLKEGDMLSFPVTCILGVKHGENW